MSDTSPIPLQVQPPIFLLQAGHTCYMCNESTRVFCLAADGFREGEFEVGEFSHFTNVIELPPELAKLVRRQAPGCFLDYLKQKANCYYVNHCRCGAKLSDHLLHNDADGAFNPATPEQAEKISLHTLPIDQPITLHSSFVVQDDDLIGRHAGRGGG